jgi:GT2 family glycosyltransferase
MISLADPQALPPWSAIIVNFNTKAETQDCLSSLRMMDPAPVEIIVVDNASHDDSLTALAQERDIRLIANPENLGFAGGANTGLVVATAPFAALVNPDIVMQPAWAAVLLQAFLADDRLGAAGGKLLYPDGVTIQAAGGVFIRPSMRGENIGRGEPDRGQYDADRDVDFIPSSALMLRRSALDAVGLLDAERFFPAFYADAEICYRLRRNGWRVRIFPKAVALHEETMTRDPADARVRFLSNLQRLQFAMKHLDRRVLLEEFLPLEQEVFLEAERYAKDLEQRLATTETYARELETARAAATEYAAALEGALENARGYARGLEQRAVTAEAYARSLEEQRVELEEYARSLEARRTTEETDCAGNTG